MTQHVTADTFSPAVEAMLDEYLAGVEAGLLEVTRAGGRAAAAALRATSPRATGGYASGWRCEDEEIGGAGFYVRVYNATKPTLSHLLEMGHAEWVDGRDTGRRVPGRPHVAPAAEAGLAAMMREVAK